MVRIFRALEGFCPETTRGAKLRAVLCNAFDGVKALTIGEAPERRPRANEVLVDVHAASVSYMDYLMACGGYQMRPPLPYVPGTDAAGIVVAVGEKVDRFEPGDRVACEGWHGAFAERMTAKASITALLPDNVDFIAGSTLLHMYLTAHYALINRAQVRPGETVLITGAAGGVGLACVELAPAPGRARHRRGRKPRQGGCRLRPWRRRRHRLFQSRTCGSE